MSSPNSCGCIAALLRDPFYPPLVSHWETYHPEAIATLRKAQAQRTDLGPDPEAAWSRGEAHYRFTCSDEWLASHAEEFAGRPDRCPACSVSPHSVHAYAHRFAQAKRE